LKSYLKSRPFNIMKRVFLLVDSRHPIKDSDLDMMDLLNESNLSYQVILTKCDASTSAEVSLCLSSTFREMMAKQHPCGFPMVHTVSVFDNQGLDTLKQSITEIVYRETDVIK
jgi:GTP-binding protein